MKILIAEDTEDSRIMLEMALASQGYEVIASSNGMEALRIAQATPVDLIISDILMPEMDGFEFCQLVKADPELKRIPFIFYTATYTDQQDEKLALALGAARFLIKPLEPQALMNIIQEVLIEPLATGRPAQQELPRETRELEEMHLSTVARKLDKKIIELEQEREALQRSEEKYRHLVESVQSYYFFYSQGVEGDYTYISPSIESILGYTPAEYLQHHTQYRTDNPLNLDNQHHFEQSIQGAEQSPYEIEIYHKDGSSRWLEIKEIPVFDRQGRVTHIEGIAHDITEHKQTENFLRRAQKMDAIGKLTSGIAHDFNNILSIILGNVELLKRQLSADENVHKQIDSIQIAATRAANLTQQLLCFARPKAVQVTSADINLLINKVGDLITHALTSEIEVKYQLADELWLTEIDSGDFEDTLLNLSINARDAMDGHGVLTIQTRNVVLNGATCTQNPGAEPGEYVELVVSDTGEGISPEMQEHIFEPFYTTKPHGKGTGLGLAMVYGFVQRSGGYIKCHSEPGIGTSFHLFLPRSSGVE